MKCIMCPRKCNVDRKCSVGFCSVPEEVVISKIMLHHYEEPVISGKEKEKGSGAIFFGGCNLKCVFCQNKPISQQIKGKKFTTKQLVWIFKRLEKAGALNINLVTPTHYTRQIIEALRIYKPSIPVVWNSSGYEDKKEIEKLKGLVDVYLVDLKYMDNNLAVRYSKANNYVESATNAILQMRKNEPADIIENGLMKKGLIIRHLVLPTHSLDSIKCLEFVEKNLGKDAIVSIMSQFEPSYVPNEYKEINRKITPIEYKRVVAYATKKEMYNCYTQDLTSANNIYTPNF